MPSCWKRCATSGVFTALATSAERRATIARGVPAGASSPISGAKLNPGTPSSALVGTSGACGERRLQEQQRRGAAGQAARRQVLQRVVGQLLEEVRVDRELADVGDQQRVTVGRRSRDDLGAGDASGAGPVLDHDLLPERLGQL